MLTNIVDDLLSVIQGREQVMLFELLSFCRKKANQGL